ncbi:extracellular matrix organizing protein FRAS1-like [Mytilus trossulus]|uniref:extracellular matrix organizing protein FRAS1-like n=1 Tax=Mytilus trossulus TaxID=6551 RepID=UPI003003BEAC
MCENVRCSSPNCDSKKGEYLQIPAEGCCPECVRRMSPCQYESQTTPHNSVWSPDRCKFCHCYDGEVTCTDQSCPSLRCRPGEVLQILADHCCPQCIPTGRPCEYAHHVFQDATEWSPIPCTMCVCRDGQTICYPIQCPSFVCPQGKSMERRPGSCCPSCVGSYCTDAKIHYKGKFGKIRDI